MAIERAAWGVALPVDPGTHLLSAEAPGTAGWSTTVKVTEGGAPVNVVVPAVAPLPPKPIPTGPIEQSPPSSRRTPTAPIAQAAPFWTGRRVLGAAMAGGGLASIVVAGGLILDAKLKYDTATLETGLARSSDSQSAVQEANVATGFALVGAVCVLVGLVLGLTAPNAAVVVEASGGKLLLRGVF